MAKYLSYGGLEKVWGLAKNYFPTVKTATVNGTEVTWTTNTGISEGNLATFAVDANGLVSLTGTTASTFAQASHAHGNITSGGAITATGVDIANGDALTIVDSSASGKLVKSSITFDGSTTTQFLTKKGTWGTALTSHQDWGIVAGAQSGTSNASSQSNPYINLIKGSTFDSGVQLKGSNNVTVSAASGVITISGLANTVTGPNLTSNQIILGNGSSAVKASGKTIVEDTIGSDNTTVPTSKAVAAAISSATSGLSGAMHFIGTSSDTMTDGQTTNPTVTGVSAFSAGDVVVDATETEFVLGNESTPKWHKLGDAKSYALSSVSITGTGALGGGGTLASNRTITHNTSGVTAGSAGPTAAVSGANAISVPRITVDEYGHVTALSSQTYTGVAAANSGKLQVVANSGTSGIDTSFTANSSSNTIGLNFINGTHTTAVVTAVSGKAPTITFNHNSAGTGSAMTTTNGDAAAASAGTSYDVLTGVTISKDSLGHITGVSTTRQKVVSNSTYSLPVAKYNTLGGVKPAYSSTGAATLTTAAATNTTTPTVEAKTTTSGRYYAVEADKNGVLFVNVPWASANNAKLQVKGSASDAAATDTGFTANASSAGVITFARSGASVASVTTSGGTVTINGVDSLKNPNSFTVGTKASSSGTATNVVTYDGSASGKAIYFSTAAKSNTNVQFAVDSNGFITGTVTDSGNTLNTAGSTDTSSKIFLIGATSQATSAQTYSHDTAYVGTDGCLYSNSTKVMVDGDMVEITEAEINTVCVI